MGLNGIERRNKSMKRIRTKESEVSISRATRSRSVRVASSTPLFAPCANCNGSMRSTTDAVNLLHTTLSRHLHKMGRKSFRTFALDFLRTGTIPDDLHKRGTKGCPRTPKSYTSHITNAFNIHVHNNIHKTNTKEQLNIIIFDIANVYNSNKAKTCW